MMSKEYKKLVKTIEYDHESVDELVEAMSELRDLRSRAATLEQLIAENKELHPFIWITGDGEIKAHHNIDDDHLKNILTHLVQTGYSISKELKSEARRRNIPVPASNPKGQVEYYSGLVNKATAALAAQYYQKAHATEGELVGDGEFEDQDENY